MARPKGAVNATGADQRALKSLKTSGVVITTAVVEQARAGCVQSQKMVLDKLLPNLKAESRPLNFELDDSGTLSQQASDILKACSTGKISHEAAASLISSLSGILKIREIEELEARLNELEQRMAKHG